MEVYTGELQLKQKANVFSILKNYNLFTRRRTSKDYKRSLQRQVSDEVLKKRASKKRELT